MMLHGNGQWAAQWQVHLWNNDAETDDYGGAIVYGPDNTYY